MNRIEELLGFTKEYIDKNDFRGAIKAVYDTFEGDDGDDFVYFLLDCYQDGLIDNPLKRCTASDLGADYIGRDEIEDAFRTNKGDQEAQETPVKNYWSVPSYTSYRSDRFNFAAGLAGYFLGYPTFYCKYKDNNGNRIGFLTLDKGLTFDQWWHEDMQDGAFPEEYARPKADWKELK